MDRKMKDTNSPTPLQRKKLREVFNIAPQKRGVDYSALRDEYNNDIDEKQKVIRNKKAKEKREKIKREKKAKETLKKFIKKKLEAPEGKMYIHTMYFDGYAREGSKDKETGEYSYYLEWKGEKSLSFKSKKKHPLKNNFNIVNNVSSLWKEYKNIYLIAQNINTAPDYPNVDYVSNSEFNLPDFLKECLKTIPGSDYVVGAFKKCIIKEILETDVILKDMLLYRELIQSAQPEFRGFKDSGNMMCVPETLEYHLATTGRRNKKWSKEEIIKFLNDDLDIKGNCGYTALDITNFLDHIRCPYKLIDVENKVFLQDIKSETKDRNLPVFVGQVWNNHLYYCEDADYIRSLASKSSGKLNNKNIIMNKKKKEFTGEILQLKDLNKEFLELFKIDKTFRNIKIYNNRIVAFEKEKGNWIYSNKDLNLVKEYCKNLNIEFQNQTLTSLGKNIFNTLYPKHKQSSFNIKVFSHLKVNSGIVQVFDNSIIDNIQSSIDINKCRTACFMDNKLGDYPVFDINDDFEDYNGEDLILGWYYVITNNQLPMRGNGLYSNQFIEYCKKENIEFKIKYKIKASHSLPADYGVKFCETLVDKLPNNFKYCVNTLIGYLGKTISKSSSGYLETDFRFACAKFWNNDNIGTIYDLPDALELSNRKRMRVDKYKCIDIAELEYSDTDKLYMVQETTASILYNNDLPIYNKILENEWIRCYELRKKMGGRLIKIKTDNVIVENAIRKVKLSNDIGGYKDETLNEDYYPIFTQVFEKDLVVGKIIDTKLIWNETKVEKGDADNYFEKLMPKLDLLNSFCLTGLAGFGKSECIKHCDWYNDPTTLKVAFTNKACETMNGETICRTFGIDFKTGQASPSKLSNLNNIKRIVNDECFMTPTYCMALFDLIKSKYPEIEFIFIGDPEQTRPIGEENINWMETSVFHNLCKGNIVRLIENQRNDLTPEYYKIINNNNFDKNSFGKHNKSLINICRTNKVRRQINNYYMGNEGIKINYDENKHNSKGQDVVLKIGTPVMSVVNDKELGLINSKIWEIKEINDDEIIIDENKFTFNQFMERFVVAYCFTNHKVQGITINEPFIIHEWEIMTTRERYTAFSRTTKKQFVKIL